MVLLSLLIFLLLLLRHAASCFPVPSTRRPCSTSTCSRSRRTFVAVVTPLNLVLVVQLADCSLKLLSATGLRNMPPVSETEASSTALPRTHSATVKCISMRNRSSQPPGQERLVAGWRQRWPHCCEAPDLRHRAVDELLPRCGGRCRSHRVSQHVAPDWSHLAPTVLVERRVHV